MKVIVTAAISQVLHDAAQDAALTEDIRTLAKQCTSDSSSSGVEWDSLKRVTTAMNENCRGDNDRLFLHKLCSGGGGLALTPPPHRTSTGKSPELQAHLDRLRVKLDQDRYDSMIEDVTADERAARAATEGGFVTYKQQISFGLHVIVMMGAFYAFGHVAGMALTTNRSLHPAIGIFFMVFAMLLETVLFVIRTTFPPKLHSVVAERARRKRAAAASKALIESQAAAELVSSSSTSNTSAVASALDTMVEQHPFDKKSN